MNKTDIIPLAGHVLVEPYEKPEQNGSLIVVDSQQNSAPVRGTVLRIPDAGSYFNVGDTIFFRKYAIDELKFINQETKEETVYIIDEREILGLFRGEITEVKPDPEEIRELAKDGDSKTKSVWNK